MAKSNLTTVVSLLWRELLDSQEMHDDVDAWYAPSECHGDVARYHDKRVQEILDECGWESIDEVHDAVVERCNGKVAYYLALYH